MQRLFAVKPAASKMDLPKTPVVSTEPKSFNDVSHSEGNQVLLTKNFKCIKTPSQFKVALRPHQSTIVQAMIDIVSSQTVTLRNGDILRSQALILSEPFGSGKTFEILALIATLKCPKAFPQSIRISGLEVWRTFTGADALIEPALIIVGSAVLKQWEDNISTYTTLKYLTVSNIFELNDFIKLDNRINDYDIILLKSGNVTGNFLLPGETAETVKDYRSLIYVFRELTKNKCWTYVVYDDFDTSQIPTTAQTLNSLFTIYVSATRKQHYSYRRNKNNNSYECFIDAVRDTTCLIADVSRDNILFTNFNVCNEASFTEESTNITIINAFKYVFKNAGDAYMGLLCAMDDNEATKILEMLNGDAINTAAAELGIASTSCADIFQRVLDKKYTAHMHDKLILKKINNVIEAHANAEPNDMHEHTMDEIDSIIYNVESNLTVNIKYYSARLQLALSDLKLKWSKMAELSGRAIERVKENIKSGDCQVCCLPLQDFDVFIIRCCGLVVCDLCGIKGNNIKKKYDPISQKMAVYGKCANCTAIVDPRKDLIFVDKNFDMDALINSNGDEVDEVKIVEVVAVIEPVELFKEIENPKVRAFMKILNGIDQTSESVKLNITHLLTGITDKKYTGKVLKILLFANYGETLDIYINAMKTYSVDYIMFGGTSSEKAKHIRTFTNATTTQVMLINSQQSCAGMHLACCTDIIMTGIVHDTAISSQIIGRGQRIGRTHNLRVHYLLYNNERGFI